MNLLQPLATGISDAANGTATIYKRGTSTPATLYTNYDGSGSYTPSAGVSLDSNGRAIVFVNEEVDVVVRDSSANVVVSTDPMATASNLEVRSSSFTGTDYTTAVTGVSYPITLAALLDKWRTSAGAYDFQVLVGGSSVNISDALSAVSGIFYNVKSTAYGAKGDSTTDDSSAIQAAIDAANAAGGGIVFFPASTYRIASSVTLKAGVSLLGAGAKGSVLALDHSTTDALVVNAGTANRAQTIRGIAVIPAASNSGKMLKVEAGTLLTVENCYFGGALVTGKCISVDNAGTRLTLIGCTLEHGGASSYGIYNNATAARTDIFWCKFILPATHNASAALLSGSAHSTVIGCTFDASGTSAGTGFVIQVTGTYTIVGNRFEAPSGGTIQPITQGSGSYTGGKFLLGNSIANSASWTLDGSTPTIPNAITSHEGAHSTEQDGRQYHVTDNTTPVTVTPGLYGCAEVRRTNNANQTINAGSPTRTGEFFTLSINNDQAGVSGTITLGTGFKGPAPFTVAANRVNHLTFRAAENMAAGGASATYYWVFVGQSGDQTP